MLSPPPLVLAAPGRAVCDGGTIGLPHEPVTFELGVWRWSDCPKCGARHVCPAANYHPDYVTATPRGELGAPEFLEIEPIHTCNLRCVMCHVSYEKVSKVRIDPRFVDKIDGMAGKWAVVGGEYEPMAHPQIAQILRGLSDRGMKIDLVSNGTLFTDRIIERIADCDIRRVTISFDGIRPATYEKIRERANYAVAMERILRFKEQVLVHNPKCYFSINYTVLMDNIDEIADAVSYWEEKGFDSIGFIAMVVRSDTSYLREQSIEPHISRFQAQIDEATRRIIDNNYTIGMSNSIGVQPTFVSDVQSNVWNTTVVSNSRAVRAPINPRPLFQNGLFPGMEVACSSPFKAVKLLYDGTLQVCSKFAIGSIYDGPSLLETWRGYLAEKVRGAILRTPKICHSCDYFRFCINAGKIDYTKPENFKFLESSDPHERLRFLGQPLIEWVGEYYLLKPDAGAFDPRFDDEEKIAAATIFHCGGYPALLKQLSIELALWHPARIEYPSNRYDFWQVGDWVMALARGSFEGGLLTVDSLADLNFARSLDELVARLGGPGSEAPPPAVDLVPILVDSVENYNIVRYGGRFIGIPQSAGPFEVDKVDLSAIDGIVMALELAEVKRLIAGALAA
jgi:MoaA/NifB/PqqE/SkfB family radical SAM enzyme